MAEFFIRYADYSYFFYGLSFIIFGAICFILRKEDPKALPWFWLGFFGIAQGITEWIHIIEIVFGKNLILETVHILGLQLSFFFLFEFGREAMKILRGRTLPIWAYLPISLLVASGARYGLEGLNATTCYFFGIAAGLYAARAFYEAFKASQEEIRSPLAILGGTFVFYAVLYGLFIHHLSLPLDYLTINTNIVVQFWGFPAQFLRHILGAHKAFSPNLGFPVQFLRTICGIFLALSVLRYSQSLHKLILPRGARSSWPRVSALAMALIVIIVVFGWVFTVHLDKYVRSGLIEQAETNVNMLSEDLAKEMERVSQASMAIGTSPGVASALQSGRIEDIEKVNRVLDIYTKIFHMSTCYVCDINGVVIASSDRNSPDSLIGNSFGFRPYFKEAISGLCGKQFAVGKVIKERGYYSSFPVRNLQGAIIGVVAVKRSAEQLESTFKHYPYFFLVDDNGIIFLSSKPDAILKSLWPADKLHLAIIRAIWRFGDEPFPPLLSKEIVDGEEIRLAGDRFYVSRKPIGLGRWSLVLFTSTKTIAQYRLFGISVTLFFCLFAMVFFAVLRQRENLLEIVSVASNQRQAVLDGATRVAIIATDHKGEITIFNTGAEKMLGYSAGEVIGRQYREIFHLKSEVDIREKELAEEFARPVTNFEAFTAYAREGRFEDREWTYIHKDGSHIFVKLSVTAQHDSEGVINGFVIIVLDITQEKRAKEGLKENVRFLQTLIDAIPTSIFYKDTGGVYLGCNKAFEERTGLPKDSIIGKVARDIFPEQLADMYDVADKELFQTKAVQTYETSTFSKKDSSRRDAIVYKAPFFDSAGQLGGLIGAELDITERKEAEEALRESEQKFKTIFDNTSDGMFLLDPETEKFYLYNKACLQMLGYSEEEFGNMHASDLHASEDLPFIHEQIKRLSRGEKAIRRDIRFRRKDGSLFLTDLSPDVVILGGKRYVLVSFRDITERNRLMEELEKARSGLEIRVQERTGELARTNLILQDEIVERKQAEKKLAELIEELKRSNAELEQFAYISSHDLQEPLRMVTSYLKLLDRRYKNKLDKDADGFIAYAVDGAVRMQRLINDLLAYSRIGTRGKEFVPTDCEFILGQALANLRTAIEESGVAITHDPLPTVIGDGLQLVQLFQNLIGNAIKFRGKVAPHVHVSASQKDGEWIFSVNDNGIGIEEQYFDRIFLIFQRLHTREEYSGTGIGLAICRKIAERHKGRIWVESKVGVGSTFYFSIPVKAGEKHEGPKV